MNIFDDYVKKKDAMKNIFTEDIQLNEENFKKYHIELYRQILEMICEADNPCETLDKIRNDAMTSEKWNAYFLGLLPVTEWRWLYCREGLSFVMKRLSVSDESTEYRDTMFSLERRLEMNVRRFAKKINAIGYVVAWDGRITRSGFLV
ncbi:hypothetical protein [Blautia sp. MSJ-36]|uniref:hypothetical protein n=1 Tax=Blautia sp. MSJ-36 TaxID=2841530 RepID=UPI001C11E199|nr:hypothetical protein [Blautia sp. MSJ-36]MBU5446317.1 hypothetical protein [Blautia sp. MSJ-36]